ncbi:cupin domain-containing protein [Microcystis aeruginosa]|uniref:cupin domain-containing protein n=1 Tax=Microcystis aeruginosa TaxID=1126 RepID=UPI0023315421|nr:iron-containing redox enzyme family protein [Microcystis aeruginosa]MDB9413553.1 iron-containing redox enzyme family protein [Microcystis aeruginosa CS-567/02]
MENLIEEALSHRAINHPYLLALEKGEFQHTDEVLKDFASQYGAYSDWFSRYLTAVISKLENPTHRNHLLKNLAEENGHLQDEEIEAIQKLGIKDEWVQEIPHPQLFKRFQEAMGVDSTQTPCVEVEIWRESFLSLLQNGSSLQAIGAIGLGTESVVKFIYKHIIEAIKKHTSLSLQQYVFFPLHTEVEDEHSLTLVEIAKELASESEQAVLELRKGMLKALNLRAAYWDNMYERALALDKSLTSSDQLKIVTLFTKMIKGKKLSNQEQELLLHQINDVRIGLTADLSTVPVEKLLPGLSSLLLYGMQREKHREEVINLLDWLVDPSGECQCSPTILRLASQLYHDFQTLRLGALTEKINEQKSLTYVQEGKELISTISASNLEALYKNKVDKLNIDFNVFRLPFALEVLDARLVIVKPGKANEMHKHAHETVFVFLQGQGKVIVDQYENEVEPGTFAVIPRWCVHQSVNLGEEELIFLAIADFGLTGKSFMGNYLHSARLKQT